MARGVFRRGGRRPWACARPRRRPCSPRASPPRIRRGRGLANPEGGAWDAPSLARLWTRSRRGWRAARRRRRARRRARRGRGGRGGGDALGRPPVGPRGPRRVGALHASDGRGVGRTDPPSVRPRVHSDGSRRIRWRDDDAADSCGACTPPRRTTPARATASTRPGWSARRRSRSPCGHDHARSVRRCALRSRGYSPPGLGPRRLAGMRAAEGCPSPPPR